MPDGPTIESAATPRRLLIVDGHAYAYRAFFAIRALSSPTGKATNAIYGFIRMLGKMVEQWKPTHLMVIWDGGLAAERMELLPEYKAHRPPMPDDLESQIDEIISYLQAANMFSFLKESCEADDCIAAVAQRAAGEGFEVMIASSDKDFMQLVSPQVKMLNPNEKTLTLHGPEEIKRKTGVEPTQIVDWLSLIGDSVDNIPGVPGVGPKTATNLLRQFGSIEHLYNHLSEVTSDRLRASLKEAEAHVRRNQQLVRLKEETECAVEWELLVVRQGNHEILLDLFSGWGFKTMRAELEQARAQEMNLFGPDADMSEAV